ncbi:hypothetical protein GLOTRDRAFT_109367 [Gloeophyllum trabeum ATCC 11539]|uniref:Protein kinase domain-containing protein n=1 Tax=Gloeophyllum trabeum (strain ATCC 11539 / FP-39264 / Madison 617) TaxID=670483 RepID=S7S5H5_GLOTA|nr:uncharacterized protein GLOTRDRAFT_109367 [Gloeophyllum trabeum ATCC 11539]EPQ61234.1 hypothetical protein GLOTRDRAFT_109367 [Gloeophyllum trabeum ATCC 11539]
MFNIHRDPRLFLRIFTAIMFSDREYLGYDPSITTLDDGSRIVTVKGKSYVIKKRIYFSPSILGRGTSCWQATRDGVTYAIKDYWTDVTREFTEAEFLEEARNAGIENVCQLVDEEILTFRGKEDTTDLVRPAIRAKKGKKKYPKQDCRVHRRLVLQPFAESIVEFETKRELIKAFIDVIQAHKALLEKVGILHRDISLNNIMLAATRDAAGQRRGVLIDLDYAMRYSEDEAEQGKQRKTATAERTGTTPFMALDLLWGGGGVSHRPEWDLESFFYVLFWICVLYDGPRNSERRISFKQTPLYHWTEGSFEEVAQNKSSVDSDKGWPNTLVRVSPYFEDLKPCLDRWRYILFKKGSPATHDEVVRILQETHDALEEEETPENAPGSVQGQSEKPISAVRQYHTRSYLETSKKKNQKEEASEDEVEEDSEDGSGKESEDDVGEEPEEDQVAEDDDVPDEDESSEAEEDSSDSSYSPSPSRARVQISSTGSRGRKRTRKDTAQEDDDDGYTESGIFPESQNAGWRSDAFTLHSPHPSSSASSWSQRTAPTSSEAKRHRGK